MTDHRPLPERLFEAGVQDLIPIIPPGAALAPSSTIAPESIGKTPGVRLANGLWCGFNWRECRPAHEDVRTWARWGANVGLRTDRYPCLDIDCADVGLADIVEQAALAQLGPAPVRVGNAPKRALMYRLEGEPFGKLKLVLMKDDKKYLVEFLAAGQQYVIHGTHPKTLRAYEWTTDPVGAEIVAVSLEKARAFFVYLAEALTFVGYECQRTDDGSRTGTARKANQAALEAPSIDELRTVVGLIPNDDRFPGYPEYIKMLHAVRAAAGPDDEDGYEIMAAWAQKRNNGEGPSVPGESVRSLWRRTSGPFSLGFPWLAELARGHGYNDAPFETSTEETTPTPEEAALEAPFLSDQWLASRVVHARQGVLRYVPANEQWLVWNKGRWQPDAELLAEDTVKLELRKTAHWLDNQGGAEGEKKTSGKKAVEICSSGTLSAVARLVKIDRAIAVSPESLDFDPWILNTPGGVVNLVTGAMMSPDPDQLCTRSTSVAPDFGGPMARWTQFLDEVTRGDVELQAYLQRLAGYCLTGSTREQMYAFIYGDGGNGKGEFLKVMYGVIHTYHRNSPMDTFVSTAGERHPTELAHLAGARFVTASETEAGKRWDEAKLKRMTGGDPVTARGMRQDFFTYIPQFKLVFIGNYRPEIRNLDPAMRRRTHLIPFTLKPKVVDQRLEEKLRAEWPAILAWMIEGCLEWQRMGLQAPASVLAATEDYFMESDAMGAWLADRTVAAPGTWTELAPLFESWESWCGRQHEFAGRIQAFSAKLAMRHPKRLNSRSRRAEFSGLTLNGADPLKGLVAG